MLLKLNRNDASNLRHCYFYVRAAESPIQNVKIENLEFEFLPDRSIFCPDMMDDKVLIQERK